MLDDAGAVLTPQRLLEIRAAVLRDAARMADRVTNQQPGKCTCPRVDSGSAGGKTAPVRSPGSCGRG
ncbi:hypothetical protein OHQ88_34085 (plasmid) [Micromonospora zamorensis]|uniref:hypothetical protein n=1 Tax=Micromonospora zamorensis TaxID=709883 RepID=UPI002E1E5979